MLFDARIRGARFLILVQWSTDRGRWRSMLTKGVNNKPSLLNIMRDNESQCDAN
jgi:hypothetical protein